MKQRTLPLIGKYRFGWFSLIVLISLFVFGFVTGLSASIWRLSPGWLIPFGLLATCFGWYLGGTKRKPALHFTTGTLLGAMIIIFVQSGIYQDLYRAYLETLHLQIFITTPHLLLRNAGPLIYFLYSALNSINNYWLEISQWIQNLIFRQGGFDLLAINLLWGSLVWAALFSMGWFLRHKAHAFTASLPVLILISTVIGISRQRTDGLIIALSALLIIIVLIEHLRRENRWENQNIDYSEDLRFDIFSFTIPVVALIMVIATIIPRISLNDLRTLLFGQEREPLAETRSTIPDSFGIEQVPLDPVISTTLSGMPRSHLIGSGVELTETVIMEIDTGNIYLPPQVAAREQPPRHYWFGHAYDIYMGSGWVTGKFRTESIPANERIKEEIQPFYRPTVHKIRKTGAASPTLYFTGILNYVDQDVRIAWHETTDDYIAVQLNALEYQVTTSVFDFSEDQLVQLDQIPPDVILDTYLQVTPELPERVLELASALTDHVTTPYLQAKSIESYLRQYEYSLDLPAPPQDRDLVDYFLFDLQRGYCDYFASAMVILARLNGLPARLAVGYAPGTYDYAHQVFIVTEANAHAWPEVYIEPIGWVPFEPTASFSGPIWSTLDEIPPADLPPLPRYEGMERPEFDWREILAASLLLILIVITGYLWFKLFRHKEKHQSTTAQMEIIYQQLRGNLMQLFINLQTEHTPRELCYVYTKYLGQISSPGVARKFSKQLSDHIILITNLYEKVVYTPYKLPTEQVRQARRLLKKTQLQAWLLKAALLFR